MICEEVLGFTESVCPLCLKRIPAKRILRDGNVYLAKTCPEHGSFHTIIWRGLPDYQAWSVDRPSYAPTASAVEVSKGCPFDCGLCREHRQHTCCVLLEVTTACNLRCPICFASAGAPNKDPDREEIAAWFRMLLASGGPYNIQLSGGEPTVRDDLPEIISLGRSLGMKFFQLNTNGLRLAKDFDYVKRLKEAGLNCVFLQFDGISEPVYERLRGQELFDLKQKALVHCAEVELGVVLVPTLVPGVNIGEIGAIIEFGISFLPTVRGVHFQPVSYFGRYPKEPEDENRFTLPEVIQEIVRQTNGKFRMVDFKPPSGENAHCSFHGNFVVLENGEVKPWMKEKEGCCPGKPPVNGAKQAQAFVAKHWSIPGNFNKDWQIKQADIKTDSLDAFLARVKSHSFSISGMAFQDAWNLDLERLKECIIHVVSPDKRIIPFCAYNLTNQWGEALYRR